MVSANVVPDLLKNVRSNLNEIKVTNTSAATSHSPLTIGENNILKTNSINLDSLISSATAAATSHRHILEQMSKNTSEPKGQYED